MRRRFSFLIAAPLLTLAALLPRGGAARAESHDAATVALGWQTENADVVAVAVLTGETLDAASGERAADFRVDRTIKGDAAVGAALHVAHAGRGAESALHVGAPHLVFLRRAGVADFAPISGAFSMRPLDPDTPAARFPDLVAAMRAALDSKDASVLRTLLVQWMEDADPGVAWSAATDFVRHVELHASLPAADGARIVAAFRRQPVGKTTKDALAFAVAATRSPEAASALVESLLLPDASRIRGAVAEALRESDDPTAEPALVAALVDATPAQRCALLGALGTVGATGAAPAVTALLADGDGSVRVEAAAALGGMARNARAKDPQARLGVADALTSRISGKAAETLPENEFRAVLWALAQLDEVPAFDALRKIAASSAREAVRDYAARLLARPRQSLVLRS
jgi:hypothetical protein